MATSSLTDWLSLVVNLAYTVITLGMFYAIKKQMFASERPYLSINIEQATRYDNVILVIKNSGKSSAYNIRLRIENSPILTIVKHRRDKGHEHEERKDIDLNTIYPFNSSISNLSSNIETRINILMPFDILGKHYKDVKDRKFKIISTYSYGKYTFNENHELDLSLVTSAATAANPIATQLSNIRQEILEIKTILERIKSNPH